MLVHSCIWAFVAETEMESDRHRWAFDSETHTYGCDPSQMVRHHDALDLNLVCRTNSD